MKCICHHLVSRILKSPPSRGAWIEIILCWLLDITCQRVAPLAGGVD